MATRDTRAGQVRAWRDRYWRRIEHARSDLDHLAAACDHLRLALKYASPDKRKQVVRQATADLTRQADDLLSTYEKHGVKR